MAKSRVTPKKQGLNWSRQLVQQRLRFLEVLRVETHGEPAVDRREKIAGFGALALVAPEAGEAGGDTEFPQLGALAPSDRERGAITLFCCGPIAKGEQQPAAHTVQLGLIFAAFRSFNNVDRLGEMLEPY